MERDVLIVSITRELAEGTGVERATRGDWRLAESRAPEIRFLVGVSRGEVRAVYETTGHERRESRTRFTVRPSKRTVVAPLPRMYGPTLLMSSSEVLSSPDDGVSPDTGPTSTSGYSAIHLGRDRQEEPGDLRLVQFPHPGFEHRVPKSQVSGLMEWKPDGGKYHNRKYLKVGGSYMVGPEGPVHEDASLGFWGEWEAPSRWAKIRERGGKYHPSAVHEPALPAERPAWPFQNTDPLVFGEAFLYTNCKMGTAMKRMPAGSIVLFGRGMDVDGQPRFVLDTCFVVDHRLEHAVASADEELPTGQDLLTDLVLAPLQSAKKARRQTRIHPYLGRRPRAGSDAPFSFFPAVRHDERPDGFARPVLRPEGPLKGMITETLRQGLRRNSMTDEQQARDVWHEVVQQVLAWDDGIVLGTHAQAPAWGSA